MRDMMHFLLFYVSAMKYSRADSRVRLFKSADVKNLRRLSAGEYCIAFCRCESCKMCITCLRLFFKILLPNVKSLNSLRPAQSNGFDMPAVQGHTPSLFCVIHVKHILWVKCSNCTSKEFG